MTANPLKSTNIKTLNPKPPLRENRHPTSKKRSRSLKFNLTEHPQL